MSDLVSVIIPAFNAEPWISETLESVFSQTHENLEVVVVDDGSSDDTSAIASGFSDPRLRLIKQSNAGACAARNRGLEAARGDLIQFLDADDLLGLNKIERQVELLRQSPNGCVAGCDTVYFRDGQPPDSGRWSRGDAHMDSDDPVQWLIDLWSPLSGRGPRKLGMVQTAAWLTPRAVAQCAGDWSTDVTQDQDGEYFARVLLCSTGIRWATDCRIYYRQFSNHSSVSAGRSERHLRGRMRAIDSKAKLLLPRVMEQNRTQASAALARQYLDVAYQACPRFPYLVHEAEAKAEELGGCAMSFFEGTRLKHVERLTGWKVTKRISHFYRTALSQIRPS